MPTFIRFIVISLCLMISLSQVHAQDSRPTLEPLDERYDYITTVKTLDGDSHNLRGLISAGRGLLNAGLSSIPFESRPPDMVSIYDLNTHLLTLQQGGIRYSFWLPQIKHLLSLEDNVGQVRVELFNGETYEGLWVRNQPTLYGHEDGFSETLIGRDQDDVQVQIPIAEVLELQNQISPQQLTQFAQLVSDFKAMFQDSARPVDVNTSVTFQAAQQFRSTFGFIVDGGGYWSGFWAANAFSSELRFWPQNITDCRAVAWNDMVKQDVTRISRIEFSDDPGECYSARLNITFVDDETYAGSLVLVSESYGGEWNYASGWGDWLVLFEDYGFRNISLSSLSSLEFR